MPKLGSVSVLNDKVHSGSDRPMACFLQQSLHQKAILIKETKIALIIR
jgi:hypothetical protein